MRCPDLKVRRTFHCCVTDADRSQIRDDGRHWFAITQWMPRRKTILQSDWPYFISARCHNRAWFELPMENVWDILSDHLYLLRYGFDFRIHSFVLMSNHYHALVTTPQANLDKAMGYFQRETAREINRLTGNINQVWGGPYHWCLVNSYGYFMNAYKYTYRNPVDAQIVERCEEYPYSTLHGKLGFSKLIIPVEEDTILFEPNFRLETLDWINICKSEDTLEVALALRKPMFEFQFCRSKNEPSRPDDFVF